MNVRRSINRLVAAALVATLLFATTPLTAAEPVRLASLEWEPYIGSELPEQGYVAALIRAAFAEQGMTVEIEFYPWARALHLARTGAVDGVVPEYFNASRESEFEFSSTFPGGPLVLCKRRSDAIEFAADPLHEPDAALQALKAWRFGVVRGYLNTPAFDAADYLIKEETSDDATNLRKLVFGRIDLAVIDRHVAEHLIRTRYPDYTRKIECMTPALADMPLHIAFSRKSPRVPQALAAFNLGLKALEADGRVAALRARYVLSPPGGR